MNRPESPLVPHSTRGPAQLDNLASIAEECARRWLKPDPSSPDKRVTEFFTVRELELLDALRYTHDTAKAAARLDPPVSAKHADTMLTKIAARVREDVPALHRIDDRGAILEVVERALTANRFQRTSGGPSIVAFSTAEWPTALYERHRPTR